MNENLKNEIKELIKLLTVSHDDDDKTEETAEEYLKYIDSIRFIELITTIESKYDIEIDSEDLKTENLRELDVFVAMIEKYTKN